MGDDVQGGFDTDDKFNLAMGNQPSEDDEDNMGWQEVKFKEYPLEYSEDEGAEFMGMMRSSASDNEYNGSSERESESDVE